MSIETGEKFKSREDIKIIKFKVIQKPKEAPAVSIVIPVYNEEGLLHSAIVDLIQRMQDLDYTYEIIIAENGSKDGTVHIARTLTKKYPQVRFITLADPNYGRALRRGILEARGEYIICDEIDICDTDFYRRALDKLVRQGYDMVVGSKLHRDARDKRPPFRHFASVVINVMLRVLLDFKGTDTHGLKAFKKEPLMRIVKKCIVEKDLFASEFVIRAERDNLRVTEIPVEIVEKRVPSINLFKRVPNVIRNMMTLFYVIRLKN